MHCSSAAARLRCAHGTDAAAWLHCARELVRVAGLRCALLGCAVDLFVGVGSAVLVTLVAAGANSHCARVLGILNLRTGACCTMLRAAAWTDAARCVRCVARTVAADFEWLLLLLRGLRLLVATGEKIINSEIFFF